MRNADVKLFKCQSCGQVVYFENTRCEACGHMLGYLPQAMTLTTLEPENDTYRALAAPKTPVRQCDNAQYATYNWLLAADSDATFCLACRHNHTIPDLSV
jgi:hypothetical protein